MNIYATIRSVIFSLGLVLLACVNSHGWSYNDFSLSEEPSHTNDLQKYLATGMIVSHLPDGARSVIIDDTQYFFSEGVWFLPVFKRTIQYMIVMDPV